MLAALRLVVDVREPVLVQREAVARAGAQLAREARAERLRDHGHVERQAAALEAVDEHAQAVGRPAGVVVAEEHRHRDGRGVERRGHGIDPSNHSPGET